MPKQTKPDWIIVPEPIEIIKTQIIKGNTTKSVGFSVVYPNGETGYIIIGKVGSKKWQPYDDIQEIRIIWS